MDFDIYFYNSVVGKVIVMPDGLYYNISCRCTLPSNGIYRVIMHSGNQTINLGVCVPTGGCFGIDTKLPQKYIDVRNCTLELSKQGENDSLRVLIEPDKPFDKLQLLNRAVYDPETGVLSVSMT